jgi:hypothetical protein
MADIVHSLIFDERRTISIEGQKGRSRANKKLFYPSFPYLRLSVMKKMK